MDKFQRILKLHQILSHRRYSVSSRILAEQMECSVSSVKKAIEEMRNYVNAQIIYDHKQTKLSHYLQTQTIYQN